MHWHALWYGVLREASQRGLMSERSTTSAAHASVLRISLRRRATDHLATFVAVLTVVLVLLTLFGAVPVYSHVASQSPHGQGSIAIDFPKDSPVVVASGDWGQSRPTARSLSRVFPLAPHWSWWSRQPRPGWWPVASPREGRRQRPPRTAPARDGERAGRVRTRTRPPATRSGPTR